MAKIVQQSKVEVSATFVLGEQEMRALDALAGYGTDAFLKVFYKEMGEHYVKPHEQGLRTLFESIRDNIPYILRRADKARAAFVKAGSPEDQS